MAAVSTPMTHRVNRTRKILPIRRPMENFFFFFLRGAPVLPLWGPSGGPLYARSMDGRTSFLRVMGPVCEALAAGAAGQGRASLESISTMPFYSISRLVNLEKMEKNAKFFEILHRKPKLFIKYKNRVQKLSKYHMESLLQFP